MRQLSLEEIIKAVDGDYKGSSSEAVTDISTDTRTIKSGSLFIPIKGEKFDGHDYIDSAIEKGAVFVLSEIEPYNEKLVNKVIYVKSTKKAIMDLAKYYRSCFNIPAIAVTGSVGKTTTKDLIYDVLSEKYNVLKTLGNFNNEIGLPLTIFRLEENVDILVVEMGMNHFNEIHNLSRIVEPDIAVITNIGDAHIENLGSREGILKAKMEITDFLKENGTLIVSGDDNYLNNIKIFDKNIIKVGVGTNNNIICQSFKENGIDSIDFSVVDKGCNNNLNMRVNIPGKHMIINSLIGYAIGKELNLTNDEIKRGIGKAKPSKMRMEIIKNKNIGFNIINDAYNANPVSMRAGLDVLQQSNCNGKKYAILGDMFELGDKSEEYHYKVGLYAGELGINVICVGKLASHIYDGVLKKSTGVFNKILYFETQEKLIENLKDMEFLKDDIIFVKASRGMKLESTVEFLTQIDTEIKKTGVIKCID